LKISCGSIRIHVELGEEREVVVEGVAVLVTFDMLESRMKVEFAEGVTDFIENVPIGIKGGGWRCVTEQCWEGVKRGPVVIKHIRDGQN
jgi:hypothetical protein